MSIEKKIRIQNLYDDQSEWEAVNSKKPRRGEIVIYDDNGIQKIKIGDGKTALKDLRYAADMYQVLYGYESHEIFRYTTGELTIPSDRAAYKCLLIMKDVGELDPNKLANFTHVESVIFEKGSNLTDIPEEAFKEYTTLKEISIPDSVTTIGASAFNGCSNLENIHLPSKLINIGGYVFSGCTKLKKLILPDPEPGSKITIENSLMNSAQVEELYIPAQISITNTTEFFKDCKFKKATLPNRITNLCKILDGDNYVNTVTGNSLSFTKELTILRSASDKSEYDEIKEHCFEGFVNLEKITISEGITTVKGSSFCNCSALTDVYLPKTLSNISSSAFIECESLSSINISSENTSYHVSNNCLIKTNDKTLVLGCKNSIIPADGTVTTIGDTAFRGCRNLYNLTIPDTVVTLGSGVFKNCSSLQQIKIPASIAQIGSECFLNCSLLSEVSFDASSLSSRTIGNYAFKDCSNLTKVSIPANFIRIGKYCFAGCSSLTYVTIPTSVTAIGSCVFDGCINMIELTIPNVIETDDSNTTTSVVLGRMFGGSGTSDSTNMCVPTSLKRIKLNNISQLANKCFSSCNSIEEFEGYYSNLSTSLFEGCMCLKHVNVSLPETFHALSIPSSCFKNCVNLYEFKTNSIMLRVTFKSESFFGCKHLLEVPEFHTSYASNFDESSFEGSGIQQVSFSHSSKIGKRAFYNCGNLVKVSMQAPGSDTSPSSPWIEIHYSAFNECCNLYKINIGGYRLNEGLSFYRDEGETSQMDKKISLCIDSSGTKISQISGFAKNHSDLVDQIIWDDFIDFSATKNYSGKYSVEFCENLPGIYEIVLRVRGQSDKVYSCDEVFLSKDVTATDKSIRVGKVSMLYGDTYQYRIYPVYLGDGVRINDGTSIGSRIALYLTTYYAGDCNATISYIKDFTTMYATCQPFIVQAKKVRD